MMLSHDQWKKDMKNGALAAIHIKVASCIEFERLCDSVDAPVNPERMKDDTLLRTNGKCGADNPQLIGTISEAVHQLNGGLDGG